MSVLLRFSRNCVLSLEEHAEQNWPMEGDIIYLLLLLP